MIFEQSFFLSLNKTKYYVSRKNAQVYTRAISQLYLAGSQSKKVLYLTFDDGPNENITPWVLDQLAQINAKATFFVLENKLIQIQKFIKR